MAVQDINQFVNQYGQFINPYGSTSQNIYNTYNRINPQLSMPYSMAPQTMGFYGTAQDMMPMPVNQLNYQYQPTGSQQVMQGLQYARLGSQLLNTKIGGETLGNQLFGENFAKGPGMQLANPFTQSASSATNIIPTSSSILTSGAPEGATAIFNPATGSQATLLPGEIMPAGFEAAPAQLTAGQMAGNYFNNLKAGSVSAGVPTYLAGRLIRSAFDDDDPTTFTGGEMLGAGISGAGAGSAAAAMLGVAGPVGILVGIGISLLGGKKKRDKARKLQKEYERQIAERNKEIREMYQEAVGLQRSQIERESQTQDYMQTAARFNNPYGLGNMAEGGKVPDQYGFGGWFNSIVGGIGDALGGAADVVGDILGTGADAIDAGISGLSNVVDTAFGAFSTGFEAAAEPVIEVMDFAGENIIEPATEQFIQPVLNTAFTGVNIGGQMLQTGIKAGKKLAKEGIETVADVAETGFEVVAPAFELVGEEIIEPVNEVILQPALEVVGDTVGIAGDFVFAGVDSLVDLGGDVLDFGLNTTSEFIQGIGNTVTGTFDGDDIVTPVNEIPQDSLKPTDTPIVQAPKRQRIDPYGNPVRGIQSITPEIVSGSAGFISPDEEMESKSIYR